jgi:hypothetical protein
MAYLTPLSPKHFIYHIYPSIFLYFYHAVLYIFVKSLFFLIFSVLFYIYCPVTYILYTYGRDYTRWLYTNQFLITTNSTRLISPPSHLLEEFFICLRCGNLCGGGDTPPGSSWTNQSRFIVLRKLHNQRNGCLFNW